MLRFRSKEPLTREQMIEYLVKHHNFAESEFNGSPLTEVAAEYNEYVEANTHDKD